MHNKNNILPQKYGANECDQTFRSFSDETGCKENYRSGVPEDCKFGEKNNVTSYLETCRDARWTEHRTDGTANYLLFKNDMHSPTGQFLHQVPTKFPHDKKVVETKAIQVDVRHRSQDGYNNRMLKELCHFNRSQMFSETHECDTESATGSLYWDTRDNVMSSPIDFEDIYTKETIDALFLPRSYHDNVAYYNLETGKLNFGDLQHPVSSRTAEHLK
ncbi:uncharacterized protein LOC122564715 [Chiloscyllium plagiosum]|uniref:uncharacterized protein LOC122564715 n=1 Tax=Chiloscyllium plagiosum TaxID=36176 RepID=UPI001CB7E736|nr:uncharacterized protein LOC122564715 [Chiloscyllium plagiosum]